MDISYEWLMRCLRGQKWFSRVGDSIQDFNFVRVSDWEQANFASMTQEWDDALIEIKNEQSEYLAQRYGSWEFLAKWSDELIPRIKPGITSLIEDKVLSVGKARLPPEGVDSIRWILLHGCASAEMFGNLSPDDPFYRPVVFLVEGYYPCGWEGDYPSGELIVY